MPFCRFSKILLLVVAIGIIGVPLQARELKKPKRVGPPQYEDLQNEVKAGGVLLVDASNGNVLYERNSLSKFPPASTVKLMTALLVYERLDLNGTIIVTREDTRVEPSNIPLRAGEKVKVSDLMKSLIIGSDNDSALALAHKTAGSTGKFVELMNLRAQQLGCNNTVFANPNGLSNGKPQYTTAQDLLKIFQKVIAIPELRKIAQTKTFTLRTRIGAQTVKNHNKLLGKYEGMGPAKTGWTLAAKHTYAAAASRDGRELHLILLHSPDKWTDARLLFDYGFANASSPQQNEKSLIVKETPPSIPPASPSQPIQESAAIATNTNVSQAPIASPPPASAVQAPVAQETTPTPSSAPVEKEKKKSTSPKLISYTIAKGDTLSGISERYHCTVKDILRHNRKLKSKRLKPGQIIRIPSS